MSVLTYVKNMGEASKDSILKHLNLIAIANDGLKNKIELLDQNDIDITEISNEWYISKNINSSISRRFGPRYNVYLLIKDSYPKIKAIVDYAKDYFSKGANVYLKDTITIKEAELLQLTDNIEYWIEYADLLLDSLVTFLIKNKIEPKYVNKADLKMLEKTRAYFNEIGELFVEPIKTIIHDLDALSDEVADEENIAILISINNKKVGNDKVAENGFIHYFNPYYYVKSLLANIDLIRLGNLKSQNELFAVKIEQIVNRRQGGVDPNIDRQIEIYQNEIIKNSSKMDGIRKKYYD